MMGGLKTGHTHAAFWFFEQLKRCLEQQSLCDLFAQI